MAYDGGHQQAALMILAGVHASTRGFYFANKAVHQHGLSTQPPQFGLGIVFDEITQVHITPEVFFHHGRDSCALLGFAYRTPLEFVSQWKSESTIGAKPST